MIPELRADFGTTSWNDSWSSLLLILRLLRLVIHGLLDVHLVGPGTGPGRSTGCLLLLYRLSR